MRNAFLLLVSVLLLGSTFALFSRATWGGPIGADSLQPATIQMKTAVHEEVWAKKFVLVNDVGTPVGVFGVFDGQLSLLLRDQNQKDRAVLAVDKDGQPALVLVNENGKIRVQFDIEDNEPRLVLLDENGKIRAQFDIEENEPRLMLLDENGKATFQTPL